MIIALLLIGCEKKQRATSISAKAPDFALKTVDGTVVKLSDYLGKVVLIEFWATWCPPCKEAIPELKALEAEMKDMDFKLLAISLDESMYTLMSFIKKNNIKYTVLVDDSDVDDAFGVRNIPTAFIIDKEGMIASKYLGYSPDLIEDYKDKIRALQ